MRERIAGCVVAAVIAIVGCSKKQEATGSQAAPKEAEACAAKTCGDCLHEAGCWWNQQTKACRFDLPKGVDPAKEKAWTNEPGDCK